MNLRLMSELRILGKTVSAIVIVGILGVLFFSERDVIRPEAVENIIFIVVGGAVALLFSNSKD